LRVPTHAVDALQSGCAFAVGAALVAVGRRWWLGRLFPALDEELDVRYLVAVAALGAGAGAGATLASDTAGAVAGVLASISIERPSLVTGLDDDPTDDISIWSGPAGISAPFILVGRITRSDRSAKDGVPESGDRHNCDYSSNEHHSQDAQQEHLRSSSSHN
jgi:hypothetical protein